MAFAPTNRQICHERLSSKDIGLLIEFPSYIQPCSYTLTLIFVFHDVDENKEFEIAIEQDDIWKIQIY